MPPYITSVERFGFQRGLKEGRVLGLKEGQAKGRREGLLEGMREGLLKGRHEGLLEGMREGLLNGIGLVLEVRFGAQGMKLLPRLQKVQDVDTLQRVMDLLRRRDTTLEDLERFIAEYGGNGAGGTE